MGDPENSGVWLSEFVNWVISMEWDIPKKFAAFAIAGNVSSASKASAMLDKPLATTERNTLLTIIGALCDYSDIKHQERGAASQIVNMTQEIGAAVTDDTIRKILAKIPDALEARSK